MKGPWLLRVLFLACIGLFFVGRWTAPRHSDDDTRKYDSIVQAQKLTIQARVRAEARSDSFRIVSEESYQAGLDAQKTKIVYQKIYEKDTAANHRYSPTERDSLLWARYRARM